ncbi:MAG: (2Fe-2S)-binding protein [Pseudomonadota bacterium]|nr:(2Fe-2S)-binding protein [Pseudomonadota bacterium]
MKDSSTYALEVTVNESSRELEVEASETLASVLRERLHLTGTKISCEEGECGACTVLVDGRAVDSCIYPALSTQGCEVETVEGLRKDDVPSVVQKAMAEAGGTQCGFCTPGFVMMITGLLREHPNPSRELVRVALSGNICRCTGYAQIEDAVADAVAALGEG